MVSGDGVERFVARAGPGALRAEEVEVRTQCRGGETGAWRFVWREEGGRQAQTRGVVQREVFRWSVQRRVRFLEADGDEEGPVFHARDARRCQTGGFPVAGGCIVLVRGAPCIPRIRRADARRLRLSFIRRSLGHGRYRFADARPFIPRGAVLDLQAGAVEDFSKRRRVPARRAELLRQRLEVRPAPAEVRGVVEHTHRRRPQAGEQAAARGIAQRSLAVSALKARRRPRKGIDVRRLRVGAAIAAELAVQVVRDDEEDVRLFRGGNRG